MLVANRMQTAPLARLSSVLPRLMAERSDLIAHGVADFDKLLRSHAKTWLASQAPFDRDDWTDHSGPVKRGDGRDARADLTEIEEGRFLTMSPDNDQSYEFREETLPYALGLLVNNELRVGVKKAGSDADAILEKILDPVRGFDFVADILAAAAGLAALDDGFGLGQETVPSQRLVKALVPSRHIVQ